MSFCPKQGQIFKALIAPQRESLAVVVSCTEANSLRGVVTVCELREDSEASYRGLPTVVEVPAGRSGLAKDHVAVASPYTIPKNCVLRESLQGFLPPQLYGELEDALKRVFGWAPWPQ